MSVPVRKRQPTELETLWRQIGEIDKRRDDPSPHDSEAHATIMRRIKRLSMAPELVALQKREGLDGEELARKRELIKIMSDDGAADAAELPRPSPGVAFPMPLAPSLSRLAVFSKLKEAVATIANPPVPEPPLTCAAIVERDGGLVHADVDFTQKKGELMDLFAYSDPEKFVVMTAAAYRQHRDRADFADYVAGRQLVIVS